MAKEAESRKRKTTEGVYPNQPVVEVVCEIRFPGELAMECRRDGFQAKVRKKYPHLLVPNVRDGQAIALEAYRLTNEDQTSGIMMAVHRFSYFVKTYQGHTKFQKEFLRLAQILAGIVPLEQLNRFGLRYINVIPFARENGLLPLKRLLNLGITVPSGVSDEFQNLAIVLVNEAKGGTLTTRLEPALQQQTKQEALVLDFDFAFKKNLRFSKLGSYLKTAHTEIRNQFESLITDEYRQFLKGETV